MKVTISNKKIPIFYTGFAWFDITIDDTVNLCRVKFRDGDPAEETKARVKCEWIKEAIEKLAALKKSNPAKNLECGFCGHKPPVDEGDNDVN